MPKLSTGLRDHILGTDDFIAGLNGGVIRYYSGTVPATADAALSGNVLLNVISNNAAGTGISFDPVPVSGVISKNPAEVWRGQNVANGVASFFRFSSLTDAGGASTTEKRLQGTISTVGADLNLSSTTMVSGNYRTIDSFNVAQPTA